VLFRRSTVGAAEASGVTCSLSGAVPDCTCACVCVCQACDGASLACAAFTPQPGCVKGITTSTDDCTAVNSWRRTRSDRHIATALDENRCAPCNPCKFCCMSQQAWHMRGSQSAKAASVMTDNYKQENN